MAIALEFIDFIIPVKTIFDKYPGGWKEFMYDNELNVSRTDWYDDHLYRTGAMSGNDIQTIADNFRSKGIEISRTTPDGKNEWLDVCVHSMLSGNPLCSWLTIGKDSQGRDVAYLKGIEMGPTIGPRDFVPIKGRTQTWFRGASGEWEYKWEK